MKILGVLLMTAGCALFGAGTFVVFGDRWEVFDRSDWMIATQNGVQVLSLNRPRAPLPAPRRPMQFAIAQTPPFDRVNMQLDMRPRGRSLIIVFAYRDPAHFDYVHLSTDTGMQQPVHNGVFHVFGGERVRISSQAGPAAFEQTNRWYRVSFEYTGENGTVHVSVNGRDIPALRAVDLSLSSGQIGLGSFDEVGDFRNLNIAAEAR